MQIDDAQACSAVFRVLYIMLKNWFVDATTTKNAYADQLLQVHASFFACTRAVDCDSSLLCVISSLAALCKLGLVAQLAAV